MNRYAAPVFHDYSLTQEQVRDQLVKNTVAVYRNENYETTSKALFAILDSRVSIQLFDECDVNTALRFLSMRIAPNHVFQYLIEEIQNRLTARRDAEQQRARALASTPSKSKYLRLGERDKENDIAKAANRGRNLFAEEEQENKNNDE